MIVTSASTVIKWRASSFEGKSRGNRGDVRYFWAPGDKTGTTRPGNYSFWRASLGVTFMWAIAP